MNTSILEVLSCPKMSVDDEDVGPITPEFIAQINQGLVPPISDGLLLENGDLKEPKRRRPREDVTSRSRGEIIEWVLGNDELIKACICPYCLKIHSRRDNARVHIKNKHVGKKIRDFLVGIDAELEEVRRVNVIGKFPVNRVPDNNKRPRVSPIPPASSSTTTTNNDDEEPQIKIFSGGDTLQNFLLDIDNQVRLIREVKTEVSTSEGLDLPTSVKQHVSRDPSPNSSLLEELNGTEPLDTPSSSSSHALPFGCVMCPCSFPRVRDLTLHVTHSHRTRFRCNVCFAEFVQPQHLEHHFQMAHEPTTTTSAGDTVTSQTH